jgi:AraC-like DNA-binding protein
MLSQGTVAHGGARMELARKVVGNTKWEYLLVLYRICGTEPEGMSLSNSRFELQTGQSPRLTELLGRLWEVSSQPGGIPAFQTKMLFCNVLEEMFVCVRNQSNGGSQALFEQVSAYIHEHYNEHLTIPRLAEQSGVNRNRLAYVFNRYAGMGPGDYLLRYRLNQAKEMLLAANVPVREIAQAVGFSDPLYFSRVFKKQFGVAPREVREKFINNPCLIQQACIPI